MILQILFTKIAKTPAKAAATLPDQDRVTNFHLVSITDWDRVLIYLVNRVQSALFFPGCSFFKLKYTLTKIHNY